MKNPKNLAHLLCFLSIACNMSSGIPIKTAHIKENRTDSYKLKS